MIQRRGGTARHDAVAWGYARAADMLGVDIIQKCEVTGFVRDGEPWSVSKQPAAALALGASAFASLAIAAMSRAWRASTAD